MSNVLYVGSDNLITVDALTKKTDGSFVNNATVTGALYDSGNVQVTGVTWPITLAYVPTSNGKYQGTIGSAANITHGNYYTLKLDAVGPSFSKHWEITIPAIIDGV